MTGVEPVLEVMERRRSGPGRLGRDRLPGQERELLETLSRGRLERVLQRGAGGVPQHQRGASRPREAEDADHLERRRERRRRRRREARRAKDVIGRTSKDRREAGERDRLGRRLAEPGAEHAVALGELAHGPLDGPRAIDVERDAVRASVPRHVGGLGLGKDLGRAGPTDAVPVRRARLERRPSRVERLDGGDPFELLEARALLRVGAADELGRGAVHLEAAAVDRREARAPQPEAARDDLVLDDFALGPTFEPMLGISPMRRGARHLRRLLRGQVESNRAWPTPIDEMWRRPPCLGHRGP